MKFTVLALLPAAIWTACVLYAIGTPTGSDADIGAMMLLGLVWLVTWSVVAIYWAARIVRFALRGPRQPEAWEPPPWQK